MYKVCIEFGHTNYKFLDSKIEVPKGSKDVEVSKSIRTDSKAPDAVHATGQGWLTQLKSFTKTYKWIAIYSGTIH